MCQVIGVADLQHETLELLEEESVDRLVSIPYATQLEQTWELDAEDYDEAEPIDTSDIQRHWSDDERLRRKRLGDRRRAELLSLLFSDNEDAARKAG